jgi:hypothetical protein
VEGDANSRVTLALRNGVMGGAVRWGDELYDLAYLGDNLYAIYQVDEQSLPPHAQPLSPNVGGQVTAAGQGNETTPSAGYVIDLMVIYTPASRNRYGQAGLESQILAAVEDANQAYLNSQIDMQLNLIHLAEIAYTESGSMNQTLAELRGTSDGKMDEVHNWRDRYGADLVAMISEDVNYCGLAYVMTSNSVSFASSAFSVVHSACLSSLTLAHELGHNQGNVHDRESSLDANGNLIYGVYPYSFGYRVCGKFRTIMAYYCDKATRIERFANPNVDWRNEPTGIAYEVDPANAADTARSMSDTAATIASFRTSGPANPPAAPANLVAAALSHSQVDLAWSDAADDESGFHIERSLDQMNWSRIAAVGANTIVYHDAGLDANTTYHYRVRGYNSAGVSDYSNVASAATPDRLAVASIHVHDLAGVASGVTRARWQAEVTATVQDANEQPVANAVISGVWGDGASDSSICATGSNGQCQMAKNDLKRNVLSISFTVTDVAYPDQTYQYDVGSNHINTVSISVTVAREQLNAQGNSGEVIEEEGAVIFHNSIFLPLVIR